MFSHISDKSFVESVLERGSIPFMVRGSLECESNFAFAPYVGIRLSGPTFRLKAVGENSEQQLSGEVFVNELVDEAVFPGEIQLSEKTTEGISKALYAVELWADFLCLATGNPKIKVEIQHPMNIVITTRKRLEPASLDRWASLTESYFQLETDARKKVSAALWWYRKACATSHYSVFDSYTAYWNSLEILCDVSPSRIKEGPEVDKAIQNCLPNQREKIRAGHILECYNRFVNYSIAHQMKDALDLMLGEPEAKQVIHQCFEICPKHDRLYQIRNDINHGNIRENSANDYERVYLRGMLLWHIVMTLLYRKLGHSVSVGTEINTLAEQLSNPPWRND